MLAGARTSTRPGSSYFRIRTSAQPLRPSGIDDWAGGLLWVMSADLGRVRTSLHVGNTPESGPSSRG